MAQRKTGNTMAKRRKGNTMAKGHNTIVKQRADNTMANRKRNIDDPQITTQKIERLNNKISTQKLDRKTLVDICKIILASIKSS